MNKGEVFVFIDVENMRNAARDMGYEDFDYEKVIAWLRKKKGATRIFLYVATENDEPDKTEYFKSLRKINDVYVNLKDTTIHRRKPLIFSNTCPSCGHKFIREVGQSNRRKGNCDAELTLDIISSGVRKKYKGIIVFSGDGDFAGVYKYVAKELKKEVTVYAPMGKLKKRTSLKIKQMAKDEIIKLEAINDLMQHNGKPVSQI